MLIRPTHVAGTFYDKNASTLGAYIDQSLLSEKKHTNTAPHDVHMVLLPHAGHFYCGHVIAKTLAQVRLPRRLVILCPNHTGIGKALSVWYPSGQKVLEGAWQTPLGDVPIDIPLAEALLQSVQDGVPFEANIDAHAREHSIEVILPFLQKSVSNLSIVPVAVGTSDFGVLMKAGLALGEIVKKLQAQGEDVGIIVSSDMHHFSEHEITLALDKLALEALVEFDPKKLYQVVQDNKISMCGVYPAIIALYACKVLGGQCCKLVNHTTSYEKGGDASKVVVYAGLFVQKRTCHNT